jgi:hypothetical protein
LAAHPSGPEARSPGQSGDPPAHRADEPGTGQFSGLRPDHQSFDASDHNRAVRPLHGRCWRRGATWICTLCAFAPDMPCPPSSVRCRWCYAGGAMTGRFPGPPDPARASFANYTANWLLDATTEFSSTEVTWRPCPWWNVSQSVSASPEPTPSARVRPPRTRRDDGRSAWTVMRRVRRAFPRRRSFRRRARHRVRRR